MSLTDIGVGTGGSGEASPPPQYFTLETFINIHAAVQINTIAVYITFSPPPPKMELLPTPMDCRCVRRIAIGFVGKS